MSTAKTAPPPGCTPNISDPRVQEAAVPIQSSERKILLRSCRSSGSCSRQRCKAGVSVFTDPFIVWYKELKDEFVALVVQDGVLDDLGKYTEICMYSIASVMFINYMADKVIALCYVPAKVTQGPDNIKAKRGTALVLTADISGEPLPDVTWPKDGDDEDDRLGSFDVGETNTVLTIKNANSSDAGRYEVFVENELDMSNFACVDILG
uniref:Ig-like domain-containing protein n=1 Tax=Stegastes partitus TaxID=144197 RepID=A0A3B4ZQV0_9TELE